MFPIKARIATLCLVLTGVYAVFPAGSQADQLKYMDDAGNIHFVDRLAQVPPKYKEQIVPPTPTPVLDKRQIAQLKRAQKEAEAERIRKEHEKEREHQHRQMMIERERNREERELRGRDDGRKVDRIEK